MVIAEPEIRKIKLNKDDRYFYLHYSRFIFLGCDGVFETMNSYKVMEFISNKVVEK
jgi:serine/threonine protein phosphatase PrpC